MAAETSNKISAESDGGHLVSHVARLRANTGNRSPDDRIAGSTSPTPPLLKSQAIRRVCNIGCLASALVVLSGYLIDSRILESLFLPLRPSHPLTAASIVLLCLGNLAIESNRKEAARVFSAGIFLIGLVALGGYLFGPATLNDIREGAIRIGSQVSPQASMAILFAALALFFIATASSSMSFVWAGLLTIAVFAIGSIILFGHILGIRVAVVWGEAATVSPVSATWLMIHSLVTGSLIWERRSIFREDIVETWRQFVLIAVAGAALTTLVSAVFSVLPLYDVLEHTRLHALQLELEKQGSALNEWVAKSKLLGQKFSSRPAWEVLRAKREGRIGLEEYQELARQKSEELIRENPAVRTVQRFDADSPNRDKLDVLFTLGLPITIDHSIRDFSSERPLLDPVNLDGEILLPVVSPIRDQAEQILAWDILYLRSSELREIFRPLSSGGDSGELLLLFISPGGKSHAFAFNTQRLSLVPTEISPEFRADFHRYLQLESTDEARREAEEPAERVLTIFTQASAANGFLAYRVSYRVLHRHENDQLLRFFLSVMLVALFGSTGVYFAVQHLLQQTNVLQFQVDEKARLLSVAAMEQKRISGELDASRQEAASLFTNSPIGVAVFDGDGAIVSANPAFTALAKLSHQAMLSGSIWDFFPEFRDFVPDIATLHEPLRRELQMRTEGDAMILTEVQCIPLRTSTFSGVGLYVDDIHERKAAEGIIHQSLREKELLLQEIHHRVKNNLQVISSLLALQARSLTDPGVKQALNESQNRVKSIALLHDLLYQSHDLAQIHFRIYLDRLLSRLIISMGDSDRIRFVLDAPDDGTLSLDQSIPCGLIVNELVTNSLKHAFRGGGDGVITVSFRIYGGICRLVVGDSGPGVEDLTLLDKSNSLGVRLVRTLVQQLDGEYEVRFDKGLAWYISFPVRVNAAFVSSHNAKEVS